MKRWFLASVAWLLPAGVWADLTMVVEWIEVDHADLHDLVAVQQLPLEGSELRKRADP